MDPFQAIVLGLVQGLTEFLPISSSGHLIIVPWLFGWQDPGRQFDVALHMGTLIAVLVYFWNDWRRLLTAFFGSLLSRGKGDGEQAANARLVWFIIAGSVPVLIVGGLAASKIDEMFHERQNLRVALLVIASMLIVWAALLLLAERTGKRTLGMERVSLVSAVVIGVVQALSLIPGISRSGSTITAGLFFGLKRDVAARFSFLLATPATLGAGIKSLYDLYNPDPGQLVGVPADQQLNFLIGFLVSGVVGFLCIHFLMRYLQRYSTMPFIIYRFALGIIMIGLVLAGFNV